MTLVLAVPSPTWGSTVSLKTRCFNINNSASRSNHSKINNKIRTRTFLTVLELAMHICIRWVASIRVKEGVVYQLWTRWTLFGNQVHVDVQSKSQPTWSLPSQVRKPREYNGQSGLVRAQALKLKPDAWRGQNDRTLWLVESQTQSVERGNSHSHYVYSYEQFLYVLTAQSMANWWELRGRNIRTLWLISE